MLKQHEKTTLITIVVRIQMKQKLHWTLDI